jgi:hypothetical protein
MMEYKKYQHLERFLTSEVEDIELGECYVFPKIDGSNSVLWWNEGLRAGSRNRELTLEKDNAGFYAWARQQKNIENLFDAHPDLMLYGEFLVPHSLKTYREDAWRKFYVFDVCYEKDGEWRYMHYEGYRLLLEMFGIDYIPAICKITNGSYEQFIDQLKKNVFLIEDGKGAGEGIVIKRYNFKNRYGRTTWAKIVTSEFKEKHAKVMGTSEVKAKDLIEEQIADKYVTHALVEKEYAKIVNDQGWQSKNIPQLLNTVYYNLVKEESWNFVKDLKNPKIDFKRLQHFTFNNVKKHKPELF